MNHDREKNVVTYIRKNVFCQGKPWSLSFYIRNDGMNEKNRLIFTHFLTIWAGIRCIPENYEIT